MRPKINFIKQLKTLNENCEKEIALLMKENNSSTLNIKNDSEDFTVYVIDDDHSATECVIKTVKVTNEGRVILTTDEDIDLSMFNYDESVLPYLYERIFKIISKY